MTRSRPASPGRAAPPPAAAAAEGEGGDGRPVPRGRETAEEPGPPWSPTGSLVGLRCPAGGRSRRHGPPGGGCAHAALRPALGWVGLRGTAAPRGCRGRRLGRRGQELPGCLRRRPPGVEVRNRGVGAGPGPRPAGGGPVCGAPEGAGRELPRRERVARVQPVPRAAERLQASLYIYIYIYVCVCM